MDVVTCDGKRHAGVHGIVAGVEVPCAAETEVGVSRSLFEVCYRGDETVEVYGESALVNSLRLVVAVVDEGSLRGEVVLRDEDRVFIVSVAYNAVSVAAFHHTGKFAGSIYVVFNGGCAVFDESDDTCATAVGTYVSFTDEHVVGNCDITFGPANDTAGLVLSSVYVSCRETVGNGGRLVGFTGVTGNTADVVAAIYITRSKYVVDNTAAEYTAYGNTYVVVAVGDVCAFDTYVFDSTCRCAEETHEAFVGCLGKTGDSVAFTVEHTLKRSERCTDRGPLPCQLNVGGKFVLAGEVVANGSEPGSVVNRGSRKGAERRCKGSCQCYETFQM